MFRNKIGKNRDTINGRNLGNFKTDPKRIKNLEEKEIMKATNSVHMLSIIQKNYRFYKIL